MPNHVHLIAVPKSEDDLRRGIGETHQRYTRRVNFRKRWRGHLRQGRFASFVLDDNYHLAAVRYVEMNPVRAGMVDRPEAYPRSSASAHLAGRDDVLVKATPLRDIVGDWRRFLSEPSTDGRGQKLQHHERTGRPLGDERFLTKIEGLLNRPLKPKKPGRKPKKQEK